LASVFDLHVHTNRGSPDSSLTPEELVTEASRLGLTGVMVTEHLGWPRQDFEEFARRQEIVLLLCLETYTPLGHIITLGLDKYVTGYSGGIETVRKLRKEVDRVGGLMILAHPFRYLFNGRGNYTQNILFEDWSTIPTTPEEAVQHPIFELVDEIEVVNGGNNEKENRFAQSVAQALGRWGTGGSDAHSVDGLGKGATVFPGDIRTQQDLLEALRAGDFFPVEGFHLGRPVDYGRNAEQDQSSTQDPQ
jgi:predicted metal-dependent phosphoesterase TrpH